MSIAAHHVEPSPAAQPRTSFVVPFVAFALAALAFYVTLLLVHPLAPDGGKLFGPDSYMQIVRLREFIASGDWYHNAISRANAPYGDVSHWTKPYELVLLLATTVFRPFMDTDTSTLWAGTVISPILHIILSFALAWAASPIIGRARLWVVPIVLLNFPLIQQALPGRADHHVFLVTILAIAIGLALRMIVSHRPRSYAAAAGAAQGLALWASVEFIFLAVLTFSFAAVWWIVVGGSGHRRSIARMMSVFSTALVAAIAVSLLAERPPADITTPDLDRISVVYLLFSVLAGVVWLALAGAGRLRWCETRGGRLAAAFATGTAAAFVMWLVFPEFFRGPYANVSPLVYDYFLRHVAEFRSILDLSFLIVLAYYSDAIIAVLILAGLLLVRGSRPDREAWLFLFACTLLYTTLALFQLRFAVAASALSAVPFAYLLEHIRQHSPDRLSAVSAAAFRIVASLFLILGPGMIVACIPDAGASGRMKPYACAVDRIAPILNAMPGRHIIFTPNLFAGPAILFDTRHSVVGTPYHRNTAGIEDTQRITSATDDAVAHRLIEKRGVDVIMICHRKAGRSDSQTQDNSFEARLKRGSAPDWLRPIPLHSPLDENFTLFAVRSAPSAGNDGPH